MRRAGVSVGRWSPVLVRADPRLPMQSDRQYGEAFSPAQTEQRSRWVYPHASLNALQSVDEYQPNIPSRLD